eukprot:398405-Rhodomonas_salina.1
MLTGAEGALRKSELGALAAMSTAFTSSEANLWIMNVPLTLEDNLPQLSSLEDCGKSSMESVLPHWREALEGVRWNASEAATAASSIPVFDLEGGTRKATLDGAFANPASSAAPPCGWESDLVNVSSDAEATELGARVASTWILTPPFSPESATLDWCMPPFPSVLELREGVWLCEQPVVPVLLLEIRLTSTILACGRRSMARRLGTNR